MIWFTSDTHFGHANIIRFCSRPFTSAMEMDETIIQNWNNTVGVKDTVFHLGDFSYRVGRQYTESIFERLNGEKHLICGNHDRRVSSLQIETVQGVDGVRIRLPWKSVCHGYREEVFDGQRVVMCHYPMMSWHWNRRGSWHLYGHVHNSPFIHPSDNTCNVGQDIWEFRPVSLYDIRSHIAMCSAKET